MSNVIFISYAKEDNKKAAEIYKKIRNNGYKPWMDDHNLLPGYDWDKEIKNAIKSSKIFILIISNSTKNKHGYIQKEIRVALEYAETFPEGEIFIIPVRIEDCDIPESLQKWQWVDVFRYGGFNKLMKTIEKTVPKDMASYRSKVNTEKDVRIQLIIERIISRNTLIIFKTKKGNGFSDGAYIELAANIPNEIETLKDVVVSYKDGTEKMLLHVLPKSMEYRKKENTLVFLEYDFRDSNRIFIYNEDRSIKSAMNIKYFNIIKAKGDDIKIYYQKPVNGKIQAIIAEHRGKIFALVMPMEVE